MFQYTEREIRIDYNMQPIERETEILDFFFLFWFQRNSIFRKSQMK